MLAALLACKGKNKSPEKVLGAAPEGAHACQVSDFADCDKQCRAGHAGSCNTLGEAYEYGKGTTKSPEAATQSYQRACDLGSMPGCSNLGTMYLAGSGVGKDVPRALGLFEKACAGGRPPACFNVGVVNEKQLTPPKPKVAAEFYEKACDAKYFKACTNLGSLYLQGVGVAKNPTKARRLYKRACDGGDEVACPAANR